MLRGSQLGTDIEICDTVRLIRHPPIEGGRKSRRPFPAIFRADHDHLPAGVGTAECGAGAEDGRACSALAQLMLGRAIISRKHAGGAVVLSPAHFWVL